MLHQDLNQNPAYAEVELDRTLFVFLNPVLESLCYENSKKQPTSIHLNFQTYFYRNYRPKFIH